MNKINLDDEIEIKKIILYLWDNKFKIIFITTLFTIITGLYFLFTPTKIISKSNIIPANYSEDEKYATFNNLVMDRKLFFTNDMSVGHIDIIITEINLEKIFEIFVSKILEGKILENGLIKYGIVKEDGFDNKDFQLNLKQNINSITERIKNSKNISNLSIVKKIDLKDQNNWNEFIKYVERETNNEIKKFLLNRFNRQIETSKLKIKFKLDDLETDIKNLKIDHKVDTTKRIFYLEEQKKIAKSLNIKKNEIFNQPIFLEMNEVKENYYLMGYELIDLQINSIKSRSDEAYNIEGLTDLENQKRRLLQSRKIERIIDAFNATPLVNNLDFYVAKIEIDESNNQNLKPKKTILIFLIIGGIIFSLIFLYMVNLIRSIK